MAAIQSFFGTLPGLALLGLLATIALALFSKTLRKKSKVQDVLGDGTPFQVEMPSDTVSDDLPVEREDPDLIERVAVSRHIADLMLADEWTQVADDIAEWESRLAMAQGGARYHDVAADVALSGLRSLIDALPITELSDLDEAEAEVGHFIDTHQRQPDNHVLAALAARAHLMVGEACRADLWPEELERDAWRRMARHFLEAGEILKNYDALAYMSPLLAEAHYRQALGSPGKAHRYDELFKNWIDLDPSNPVIYEVHADSLANPDDYTDDMILAQADEALERTEDTLGAGGYALFFMPLLERREGARDLLDHDLFSSAMLDLASNEATQAEVNQTANALAAELRISDNANAAMKDTLLVLISWHLDVIYPRLWSVPETAIQNLVRDAAEAVPDMNASGTDTFEVRAA